jgi:hypothetical protein
MSSKVTEVAGGGLAEALGLLMGVTRDAMTLKVIDIPGDPRHVLISQGGENEERAVPGDLIASEVESLADLVALAVKHSHGKSDPTIWHNSGEVVALLDYTDRRERVTLSLNFCKVWKVLCGIDQKTWSQEELKRLFRVDLNGLVPAEVVASVRNVKFTRNETATGNITHTEHGLGRSIEMSVSGADKLVEQFVIETPVYSNALEAFPVRVPILLDVDHNMNAPGFRLAVAGDTLTKVMRATQDKLREVLRDLLAKVDGDDADGAETIAVYYGTP